MLAFLAGLGAIIVPHHSWPWPPGRLIGVIVVGCALLLEIIWMLPGQPLGWLLPRISTATAPEMQQEGANYLFGDAPGDEIRMNLRRCVALLEHMADRRPAP